MAGIKPVIKPGGIKPVITPSQPAVVTKRPTPPSNSPNGAKKPELTVSSSSKRNDQGVQTLVGDYEHVGMNHGKKYYKKVQGIPGHKDVKVFLYYWDNRDGPDGTGWWFGDQLGGEEVWARAASIGSVPPSAGWKVPWNALKPEPGLLTVAPFKGSTPATAPAKQEVKSTAPVASVVSGPDPRVKKATAQVEAAENATKPVLTKAKTLSKDSALQVLKQSQEALQKQVEKLNEVQKALTQDIAEARKAGPTGISSVTELSKLSPKLRMASSSVTAELTRIKNLVATSKSPEELKKIAEKEQKEYEDSLPALTTAVDEAVEAVETVTTLAAPIVSDPPEDPGSALNEIDEAATSAQTKVHEVRQKVTAKLATAKNYSSTDVRKVAVTEYTSLQNKLIEEQKKLDPLKTLKRDFAKRIEAKKALADITEKIGDAELEAEKASMMTAGSETGSQMSEEDVKSGEEIVLKARNALSSVTKLIEAKIKSASGPMKDELMAMKSRLGDSTTKVNKIGNVLKTQREGLALQSVYTTAHEKVDKAEEAFSKCADAELPFLKGIEVLPQEESDKAIEESEAVAAETSKLLNDARTYLSQKAQEIRKYSKETQDKASEELKELSSKVEEITKKLTNFKKETQERKVAAVMAEVVDCVMTAETKGKSFTETGAPLGSSLDEKSVEELKEAIEKIVAADKECTAAVNEAKKLCGAKQKASRDRDIQNSIAKLMERINKVQNEMAKVKKNMSMAEKVIKGKELSAEIEIKLAAVEAEVEALVKQATPEDDGLGVETVSDAAVLEIDGKLTSFAKELKPMQQSIANFLTSAPAASKAAFTNLSERNKVCANKIEEVKVKTKGQREKVLSVNYVQECTEKTVETEATLEKLAEAEAPYLTGVECLDVKESVTRLKLCDDAAVAVQSAINSSKQLIASKQAEMKKFDPTVGKPALEDLVKLTERITAAVQQLSQFKKDTDSRKKTAALQEAGEKVKSAEAEVTKVSDFITPLADKDPDALSPEEAAATIKNLEELETAANICISETRNFCDQRMREATGDKEKVEQVKEMQSKLKECSKQISEAKKTGSGFIDKIKGKALVQEAENKLKEAEAELEKGKVACAPLLEEKGQRFLVKQSLETVAVALRTHMEEKSLSLEDMQKEIGQTQDAFVTFVGKMPEAFGREECSFSTERREAMFKSADADGDGAFSLADFKVMLTNRFTCVNGVSVTDVFDIGASKTVCKLEKGALVESTGAPKKPENADGMPRLQCKVVESGEEGWITMQGNNGTKFLERQTPFSEWMKELDATLATHGKIINQIANFFSQKAKELASAAKDTPLAATREQLKETGIKTSVHINAFSDMKKQLMNAKQDYFALAKKEKNAHIEAKEQAEADVILAVAKPAVEAMDGEFKKLEEASSVLLEKVATPDLLQEFATPLTVVNEAKTHETTLKTLVAEAKEVVKAQQEVEAIKKATKGPILEAKMELQKWFSSAAKLLGNAAKIMTNLKQACNQIADKKSELVVSALRADLNGSSVEEYFAKLSSGGDFIMADQFCSHISGLPGVKLADEQAKLIAKRIDADGICRRSFLHLVQQYMKVTQGIAITPKFEVLDTKEKMVRKAEVDEILEVLEGPAKDEKSGLDRVRVKALTDGAEGWISVKGNQGKTFMEKTEKLFFSCVRDAPLAKDFKSSSEAPVRVLKAEEVVELIEGPRSEILSNASRARVKASSDNKIGWVTIKDQTGLELVEKNSTIYTCTSTVALTDAFDISACKVIRKMAPNEVLVMTEGPVTESSSGITRVKGRCQQDDAEGWVTITGNAGTVFAKLNSKLYTVKKEVALQKLFASDSADVRTLAIDEALEMLEGPKEEKFQPAERMKVRASDGAVGWITKISNSIKKWSPTCKAVKQTPLYISKGMKEAVVRDVGQGETMIVLEGPLEVDGAMWFKGRMKKDDSVGWGLIKDESGERLWH